MITLDLRMAMDATAETTILTLFLFRLTNAISHVLEIQTKSVVIRGDFRFTDQNPFFRKLSRLQLLQRR